MQKENYGNSNISPCKNIIFQKSSKRNQNPSIYYNSITNLKFQHKPNIIFQNSSYKNRPITQGPKSLNLLYSVMNLHTISLPWQARPTRDVRKSRIISLLDFVRLFSSVVFMEAHGFLELGPLIITLVCDPTHVERI